MGDSASREGGRQNLYQIHLHKVPLPRIDTGLWSVGDDPWKHLVHGQRNRIG